jgi:hypothetical protein
MQGAHACGTARNCAFVNFTNISNAIKAIEGIKNKPDYGSLRIAHGKDRCANPPRSGPQGGASARRAVSGASSANGPASAGVIQGSSEDGDGHNAGEEFMGESVDLDIVKVEVPEA